MQACALNMIPSVVVGGGVVLVTVVVVVVTATVDVAVATTVETLVTLAPNCDCSWLFMVACTKTTSFHDDCCVALVH